MECPLTERQHELVSQAVLRFRPFLSPLLLELRSAARRLNADEGDALRDAVGDWLLADGLDDDGVNEFGTERLRGLPTPGAR